MSPNPVVAMAREFGRVCSWVADDLANFLWPAPAVQRAHAAAEAFADLEAEEEVSEPTRRCPNQGSMCNCTGACLRPAATVPAADLAGAVPPPEAAPAGSPTWDGWAVPAILEVLADHKPTQTTTTRVYCGCGFGAAFADRVYDWFDWHEHVAPLIAARVGCDPAKAIAALRMTANRQMVETGHDIGGRWAAEMFPQHTRNK